MYLSLSMTLLRNVLQGFFFHKLLSWNIGVQGVSVSDTIDNKDIQLSMLKLSHYTPKQSYCAQLCSHLFGYHCAQNYAGIICQGLSWECPSRSCRGHSRCHATFSVQRVFLDHVASWAPTLYVLHTITMPTANLSEMPYCFLYASNIS